MGAFGGFARRGLNSLRKSHSYGRKTPGAKCGVSNSASNLVTATYPNGLQSTFQYDTMNRLTSMTAGTTAAYGYTLGPTSVRTNAIELSGRSVTWGFDGIYQLTGETTTEIPSTTGSVSYGLDPVGNRLSQSSSLHDISSLGFSYNADDQILGEQYDANGNTTATGGKTFAYDSENHLASMNGGVVSMVYEGDGNRVVKDSQRCRSSRIDQPTTLRLNRSMTTARNSQPSSVGIYVMSPLHERPPARFTPQQAEESFPSETSTPTHQRPIPKVPSCPIPGKSIPLTGTLRFLQHELPPAQHVPPAPAPATVRCATARCA